jgi:hypothetical protein
LRALLHRLLKTPRGSLALESTAPQVTEKHQGGYWLLRALLHWLLKNTKGVTGS